jgi:aromatic ring-opening dioxygenase LigB subunit
MKYSIDSKLPYRSIRRSFFFRNRISHWVSSVAVFDRITDDTAYGSNIDVTSYDDIVEAVDDGRFETIIEEHKRYMEETECEAWAL